MSNFVTNLLPAERRHQIARDYYFRLGVIALLFTTALVGVAMVLLLPTYVYLSGSASTKERSLEQAKASLSSADDAVLSARLAALTKETLVLRVLSRVPSSVKTAAQALTVPRPGITLSGITYTPKEGVKAGTITLSGTATTRAALRNYQLALQGQPFAKSVDLPVSAYAKDTDIGFLITITLTP